MESTKDVLIVVHDGQSVEARSGSHVVFGRGSSCTVRVGVNDQTMHRRAGSFQWHDGRWQVHNDGSRCLLEVDVDGGFQARIAAGSDPLILPPGAYGSVRILVLNPVTLGFATPPIEPIHTSASPIDENCEDVVTSDLRELLGLTPQEVQMLTALCEPRLRNPRVQSFVVPTSSEVCARMQITNKRAEDLVDSLSVKLSSYVGGVIGSNDGRATTRRQRIAAFALDTRCVTVADLKCLP
jgi:hypothetical protein